MPPDLADAIARQRLLKCLNYKVCACAAVSLPVEVQICSKDSLAHAEMVCVAAADLHGSTIPSAQLCRSVGTDDACDACVSLCYLCCSVLCCLNAWHGISTELRIESCALAEAERCMPAPA